MRKLLTIICCIVCIVGCNKKPEHALIEGSIKGLGTDTILLISLEEIRQKIDTIYVVNDKFSFMTDVDTLTSNLLIFKNGETFPLFLSRNLQVNIEGDTAHLDRLKVKGGNENAVYANFIDNIMYNDSAQADTQTRVENFIKENNTSIATFYLIEKYFAQDSIIDIFRLKNLIEGMPGIIQDNPRMSYLLECVKQKEKISVGRIAPFFNLKNIKGEKVTRNEKFSNKFLVINFWASWDPNAKANNEAMRRLYKKYKNQKDVGLLSVSLDLDRNAWKQAVENDTLVWEQACDFNGIDSELTQSFNIKTFPTTLLLAQNGRIIALDLPIDSIPKLLDKEIENVKAKEKKRERIQR